MWASFQTHYIPTPVLLIAEYGFYPTNSTNNTTSDSPSVVPGGGSSGGGSVMAAMVNEPEAYCQTRADTFWNQFFFLMTISVFFLLPLVLLLVLYTLIARRLVADPGTTAVKATETSNVRARKQVVLMLGTVVMFFFICLLPFRVFTIIIIFMSTETFSKLGFENYMIVLLICRMMLFLNSAINPILYNLMSTKFREGFMRLCGFRRRDVRRRLTRSSTLNTTTTSMRYVMRSCSLDSRSLIFANNSRHVRARGLTSGIAHGNGHGHPGQLASFRERYTAINLSSDEIHPESYV
ncbi:Thyrotropin-releasing hormone receptor [Frankliniella fusca]|uniref:Thyrotropin-releasing hormone receptor n=1 Tax=Frankliniella fusca TaxID=407009 RepID=A0AAE1HDL5_9NEOP|nr:Thyrotropin-releasing hormone receptor [Frankliniella fusca]